LASRADGLNGVNPSLLSLKGGGARNNAFKAFQGYQMLQTKSNIVSNKQFSENCWHMVLAASEVASQTKPGQFIMLKINETHDPLFRRPFSVFRVSTIDQKSLNIEIVYKMVGRGTRYMTHLREGNQLDIIGPLGNGFEFYRDKPVQILLAGGTGSASLFMLGEELSKASRESGFQLYILLGARTKQALLLEKEFGTLNGNVLVSTNDGTYGYHGFVTEMLKAALDEGKIPSNCAIYASGPEPMFKSLAPICQHYRIPTQISVERHMMCGIGGCFVCVCKVDINKVMEYRDLVSSHIQCSPEQWGYALVCKDGPVFHIDEVMFDE
jgi:dihydroorotate dehydrogenase electron transfer subunit